MAKARVFSEPGTEAGVYHVVSRVVDGRMCFGDDEKFVFCALMQSLAAFHQVEILTYCVMGNHFHLLVKVPRKPETFNWSFEELMQRWQEVVGPAWLKGLRRQFENCEPDEAEKRREEWRQRMLDNMFSLGGFMKALKQRFTQCYNRTHDRRGTLWEGRYKSVIVEDEDRCVSTMTDYINLNPVRAGLTDDCRNYRWCGPGEAAARISEAREGSQSTNPAPVISGPKLDGENPANCDHINPSKTLLMKRIKHFTCGVIVGSRKFINNWFNQNREWFSGRSRTARRSGARAISKEWKEIYNLRTFRPAT